MFSLAAHAFFYLEAEIMEEKNIAQESRRKFLKKAGTVAAAAPAAALLLSASAVPNKAMAAYGGDNGQDN
jgi:hypothetical protein